MLSFFYEGIKMQKPLDFCVKFNRKVNQTLIGTILESAFELYSYGLRQDEFRWDNNSDNACTLFHIDFFNSGRGDIENFGAMTNIVITITHNTLIDDLQFYIIDIFNDHIDLCEHMNGEPILSIPLTKYTDVDEGYVFQIETESSIMPFTVEHLKMIQYHASMLDDDYSV